MNASREMKDYDDSAPLHLMLVHILWLVHRLGIPNRRYALRQDTIHSKGLCHFSPFLQQNYGIAPQLWQERFHPNPFKFPSH
jgi:hypothetical protein